jgi:hypothetical protein
MSSGVGGLPANSTPATWPSGHHFKERHCAPALIMRAFFDCSVRCGWSRTEKGGHADHAEKFPGRGKESGGLVEATGSDGWQREGARSSITRRSPPQRRALGERAASQTCQQAKRQGPKFLVDQTPRSPNHDPAFSADSHTCNEAPGQQGSVARWLSFMQPDSHPTRTQRRPGRPTSKQLNGQPCKQANGRPVS